MRNKNFKLYFKCIFNNENYAFISGLGRTLRNDNILITAKPLYFTMVHFRLSSLFYSSQLVDIFSYELPNIIGSLKKKSVSSIVVYNMHTLSTQNRFFLFLQTKSFLFKDNILSKIYSSIPSISELFYAANWLEREVAELHSISFSGKKDLRNLMLQYGDSSAPFKKSFPSIGIKEMFYNPIKDTIVQNTISIQI